MANFGIDLLLESQKSNIKSKNDILLIIAHWLLCKNNVRNVGIGDNKIFSENDRASELLPSGWNQDSNIYTLRYTKNEQIFILFGVVTNDSLLVNLLDAKTLKTASLVFDVENIVKSKTGATLDDFVNNSESLIKRFNDEILEPIMNEPKEKKAGNLAENPLTVRPMVSGRYGDSHRDYFEDPLQNIGRGDLDPFGRGGGMLFRPYMPRPGFSGPRHPGPLSNPPGARFDPPNPFGRLDPNNDHFPPPGSDYDDMFN